MAGEVSVAGSYDPEADELGDALDEASGEADSLDTDVALGAAEDDSPSPPSPEHPANTKPTAITPARAASRTGRFTGSVMQTPPSGPQGHRPRTRKPTHSQTRQYAVPTACQHSSTLQPSQIPPARFPNSLNRPP
ncbi:hypothetical protein ACFFX0_04700 [Citricoccus parietis]|uniref:Uncharacterized protein n=1 Tax=Citricoccus parietis TaxID=592307 RepID=A0ABV5FV10_9MICC